MPELSEGKCVPCEGGVSPLNDSEISQLKSEVPGWDVIEEDKEKRLKKVYKFSNFSKAMNFSQSVGKEADLAGHHPMLITEWGKTTVVWWTHDIGGLHRNDFIMAAKTEQIASSMS